MTLTSDKNIMIEVEDLTKVITVARAFPSGVKMDKDTFMKTTLDKWQAEEKKEKTQSELDDEKDLVRAFWSIADRHKDLKGKEG